MGTKAARSFFEAAIELYKKWGILGKMRLHGITILQPRATKQKSYKAQELQNRRAMGKDYHGI
jgi:hypothetical protein